MAYGYGMQDLYSMLGWDDGVECNEYANMNNNTSKYIKDKLANERVVLKFL